MYCSKCQLEFESDRKSCPRCGSNIQEIKKSTNKLSNSNELISSVLLSVISFVVTIVFSFSLHEKIDSTPSALSANYVMAVPNNVKPFVIAVPVIFTLITTIKTVMTSKMNIKEKIVSFIVAIFSLMLSIAMINFCLEI